ncbi:glycosyltransferase [Clostridium sp.]|uniref:glycosyltransferase n=1 Tax=Clostridium sp. TaxID=1506 RepID=UPI001A3A9844|nr:glycosyltransferase [Clostridium sp.]MBK5240626.1 glycosyltransferase [Clostridium sp.]
MKKVVYVVESFAAGVYSLLHDLCNAASEDYEVVIIYSLRKRTPENFVDDFNPKIRFIETNMCRGLNPRENIRSLIQLKKILKAEHPDIIHLHSSKAGFLGRLACFANRFDMDKVFYNPHGFSFLQINESKFKRRIFYGLEWFASKLGGYIVACSKGEFDEALKISKQCIKINNGIDTNKIDEIMSENNLNEFRSKINNKRKKLKIATVGRICHQKNPELFNEIAKYFKHYDFLWIGDGELMEKLTADNIKITGWTERKQVIKELIDIDIFVLTSRWEGLPISLLEAMYIGKPSIVTNVMGNKDVVRHNFNGYIANDLSEFIHEIKHIASNNIILDTEFVNRVRASILEEYDKNRMVKKYIYIYEFNKDY